MKRLTIRNLYIQMDAPDDIISKKHDKSLTFASEALDLINRTLQREPYGLAAQLLFGGRPIREQDISVEEME